MQQLDKNSHPQRWFLLFISIWINFGAWFCFDHPAALYNSFKDYFTNIDDEKFEIYFGGLYSVYSLANIFLPFIGGRLRDNLGDRLVLVIMCLLITFGQSLFVYGIYIKSFLVMYIGRITLGWGIESVLPAQNSFISPYFEKDYLSFAFGLIGLFATFGSVLVMWLLPVFANRYGLLWAVGSGIIFNLLSLLCAIIVTYLDKRVENKLIQESKQYQKIYEAQNINTSSNEVEQKTVIQEVFCCKIFWYVSIYYAFIYASIQSFSSISIGLLSERWLIDDPNQQIIAGRMVSLQWLASGITTPIFGYLIDKYGYRAIINILAAFILFFSLYITWYINPIVGMIIIGITYSLTFATVWSSIIYIITPEFYGIGLATVVSIYSLFFTITPLVVGYLRSSSGSYEESQQFLMGLSILALILSILIFKEDRKLKHIIDGKNKINDRKISNIQDKY